MRRKTFNAICQAYTISPSIALEDKGVVRILRDMRSGEQQEKELKQYLKTQL